MLVEVIDLLSSSSGPSPPPRHPAPPKRAATPPRRNPAPSRAPDYDILDLTTESPTRSTIRDAGPMTDAGVAPGSKRTSIGHHRHDDDFLFLSDDFDVTGDLDAPSVSKRPRISPSSPRGKRSGGGSSSRRTVSAAVTTKGRQPLQPARPKRWNSMADPIEHSSSPHNASAPGGWGKASNDWLDSIGGSRGKQTEPKPADSARSPAASSDLFISSPPRSPTVKQATSRDIAGKSSTRPDDLLSTRNTRNKPQKKTAFVDLSSDPFDIAEQAQKKPAKKQAAWDPISSSMPETGGNDYAFASSSPRAKVRSGDFIDLDDLDGSGSDEFPDLAEIDFSKVKKTKRSYSASPRNRSKSTGKRAKKTAEEKEAEKKQRTEQRDTEKERKRAQKEQEKEQRALDNIKKKALEEVNKVRTDKKVSTPEMIVDLPSSLEPGLKVQIQELLKDMDVEHGTWSSRVGDVVKWRRKVICSYNEEMGHWEPVDMHIKPENHVLVIVGAADFVKLALGVEGHDLEAHVLKMKTNHPDAKIIYLIEGLTVWMRKNRNVRNRQFQSAVRTTGGVDEPTTSGRRRNDPRHQEYIDEDSIEDALLSLQVQHGALIHHTSLSHETAQWVAVFTQHISMIPYRRAREAATAAAGFCMESGQVRTGDGARDTYVRMLQEMARVTTPIAHGVAAEFGSVPELVRGLEARGPLALENCRKSANSDGAFTDRVIGPAVSCFGATLGQVPGRTLAQLRRLSYNPEIAALRQASRDMSAKISREPSFAAALHSKTRGLEFSSRFLELFVAMTRPGGPGRALESLVLVGVPRVTDRRERYWRNSPSLRRPVVPPFVPDDPMPADESEHCLEHPRAGHGAAACGRSGYSTSSRGPAAAAWPSAPPRAQQAEGLARFLTAFHSVDDFRLHWYNTSTGDMKITCAGEIGLPERLRAPGNDALPGLTRCSLQGLACDGAALLDFLRASPGLPELGMHASQHRAISASGRRRRRRRAATIIIILIIRLFLPDIPVHFRLADPARHPAAVPPTLVPQVLEPALVGCRHEPDDEVDNSEHWGEFRLIRQGEKVTRPVNYAHTTSFSGDFRSNWWWNRRRSRFGPPLKGRGMLAS
ncbi:hypothetical protein DL764_001104 [Monosporascus ibericus]|uniref:ERCC4 domain-containing protein n=1 Tax=Monosporascus ibericus TaxID=155417 RepID=A0A4Q4TSE9_9PEZI|nr:hypothetical protein DL764_001104 [Monosporascus ibericus]